MKLSIFSFLILSVFAFSSCEKGDYSKDKWDKGEWVKDGEDKAPCFEFVYPVSYEMPDGSTVTGNDEAELETGLKAWYVANPESKEKPALQYPVDVIFKDEITKTINNDEEMGWAKKACDEKEACFKLVYPVVFNMPDGTTVTGNEEEVGAAIKAWDVANPESEDKPSLQYPVDIIFKDEVTKTINNEEEMIMAKKACDDKGWSEKVCFGLVYPVTYLLPDNTTVSGADKDEVLSAIKAWYIANPDSEAKPSLQYPVDIMFKDETTQTIHNEEEMIAAKKDCYDDDIE